MLYCPIHGKLNELIPSIQISFHTYKNYGLGETKLFSLLRNILAFIATALPISIPPASLLILYILRPLKTIRGEVCP